MTKASFFIVPPRCHRTPQKRDYLRRCSQNRETGPSVEIRKAANLSEGGAADRVMSRSDFSEERSSVLCAEDRNRAMGVRWQRGGRMQITALWLQIRIDYREIDGLVNYIVK